LDRATTPACDACRGRVPGHRRNHICAAAHETAGTGDRVKTRGCGGQRMSFRGLRKMLRKSSARLRYLVGHGMLRVRDPRISASSLAILCDKIRESLEPSTIEHIAAALGNADGAYSWERAANLLGLTVGAAARIGFVRTVLANFISPITL